MSVLNWFGFRFVFLCLCATLAWGLTSNLPIGYRMLAISLVLAAGLFIIRKKFLNFPEAESTEAKSKPRIIPPEEFTFDLLQKPTIRGSNPTPSANSSNPLIKEIATHPSPPPKEITSKDFDQKIKQKIYESLDNAEVRINVVVERQGKGWEISKAKSRIHTPKRKPQPLRPQPRRRLA